MNLSIIHPELVSVALVVQHAKRECHIILSSLTHLALLYFRKKVIERKMCFSFLYNFYLKLV
jgi:hypothetical protein